jgi:hypothetical protein
MGKIVNEVDLVCKGILGRDGSEDYHEAWGHLGSLEIIAVDCVADKLDLGFVTVGIDE